MTWASYRSLCTHRAQPAACVHCIVSPRIPAEPFKVARTSLLGIGEGRIFGAIGFIGPTLKSRTSVKHSFRVFLLLLCNTNDFISSQIRPRNCGKTNPLRATTLAKRTLTEDHTTAKMPNEIRDLEITDDKSFPYIFSQNVTIPLKSSTGLVRCNVYRPKTTEKVPVLITYGPYGKDIAYAE